MHDWKAHRQTTVTAPVRRPGTTGAGPPDPWHRNAGVGRRWRSRPAGPLAGRGSLARGRVGQLLARAEVERHRLAVGTWMAQVPAVDREHDPARVADLHRHR